MSKQEKGRAHTGFSQYEDTVVDKGRTKQGESCR